MRLILRRIAAFGAAVLCLALVPTTANAASLPAPVAADPAVGATVDQPVFTWSRVEGAAYYEIEVALDDQFVTLVDPPRGASPDVPPPIVVYGTAYIPTRTYQAKTMYWHVRAVRADTERGDWSVTRMFVRRWTNTAEPAGADVSGVPASRVEGVKLLDGQTKAAINDLAFTWDAVPGAAYYEVQISTLSGFGTDPETTVTCTTPHAMLAPHIDGQYVRRSPASDPCGLNSPIEPWQATTWVREPPGSVTLAGTGVKVGQRLRIRYPGMTPITLAVEALTDAGFVVPDTAPVDPQSNSVEWYPVTLQIQPGGTYYVRVRAVDYSPEIEYPWSAVPPTLVRGMWSDHRREPNESPPAPLTFDAVDREGTGSFDTPATPLGLKMISTDIPALRWEPVKAADLYRVIIALDRDFTDVVGMYTTRSATFVPSNTLDDNGVGQTYFWYALPCSVIRPDLFGCVPDAAAINTDYVATFAKRSAPVTGLTSELRDPWTDGSTDFRFAILRWNDALTASGPATPGGVLSYQLQISPSKNWASAPIITTDNLAYATTLSPAAPGGSYHWRVRPLDGDGAGLAWSEPGTFTLTGPPVVQPTSEPTLPPSPSPSPGPTQPPELPNPTPSANYDINPGAGGGTGNVAPTRPGKPAVSKVAKRTLRVRWNASTAFSDPVTGYLLFRSINGSEFALAAQTSARRVRLRAKPGATYRFYVVANSAAGRSSASVTRTFTMR